MSAQTLLIAICAFFFMLGWGLGYWAAVGGPW
jgi:hypothetical protein